LRKTHGSVILTNFMRPCLFGEQSIYKHHRMILPAVDTLLLLCYAFLWLFGDVDVKFRDNVHSIVSNGSVHPQIIRAQKLLKFKCWK